MSPEVALFGHGAMSDLSPISGEERKLDFGAVRSVDDATRTLLILAMIILGCALLQPWEGRMSKSAAESVQVVQPGKTYVGKQGFSYGAGASTETVGAKKVCLNVLPMPPGAKAKVHYHKGIETIAYLLEGECSVYYGDGLEYRVMVQAGDQVYMPEDVPHAPYNQGTAPCKWLVVHSSGSDQDGIVLLPELDLLLAGK
jgi:uncharacterized RmlC-like cupin family protein